MVVYADTSFLLSLYTFDANHECAAVTIEKMKIAIVFTSLQRHEFRNAIRLCVFRKDISVTQRDAILKCIEDDLRSGFLVDTHLGWAELFYKAETLSATHTERLGIRGMDILHIAAASVLETRDFLTFDQRQKALAEEAGLRVRPSPQEKELWKRA